MSIFTGNFFMGSCTYGEKINEYKMPKITEKQSHHYLKVQITNSPLKLAHDEIKV